MSFLPDTGTLITYTLAAILLFITPGPDMSLALAKTMAGGRRAGMAAMLGAMAGCAVHTTLAALGLSATTSSAAGAGATGALAQIAACESGGDPTAVSASGRYRGKYQFSRATWRAIGGTGDPATAPEAVQDRLAAALYAREGSTPWPVCGAGL